MKKAFMLLVMFFIVLMLFSCTRDIPEFKPPIGLWLSETPYIVIDIQSEERGYHYGTYNDGEEDIEIYVLFGFTNNFHIRDNVKWEKYNEEHNLNERDKYEYFSGWFEVRGDKMYYTLNPKWQEMHGFKKIVFTKVVD